MKLMVDKKKVLADVVEDEIVIINLISGNYYGLKDSEVVIWKVLENGASLEEVLSILSNVYGVERGSIEEQVSKFLSDLKGEGLVSSMEGNNVPLDESRLDLPATLLEKKFTPPTLEIFTDMQDFLLVDPIHEVDERGFPKRIE